MHRLSRPNASPPPHGRRRELCGLTPSCCSWSCELGFGGNAAAHDAERPRIIIKSHYFEDSLAVFTDGSKDSYYGPEGAEAEAAAKAAGMATARFMGQGVGHRADAIVYGLPMALPSR